MKYFNDGSVTAVDALTANLLGFKTMSQYSSSGTKYQGISTSGWSNSMAASPSNPMANVGNGTANSTDCIVVGIAKIHADPNLGSTEPVYFHITGGVDGTAAAVIDRLSLLPYFTRFGNTPVSTTNQWEVVKQLYEAGMWFLTQGGVPPISAQCRCNYDFQYDDCWNGEVFSGIAGNDEVYSILNPYATPQAPVGTLHTQVARPSTTGPWMSYFDCAQGAGINTTAYISVADTITISGDSITIEYVGKKNSYTQESLLYDARDGGGAYLQVVEGGAFDKDFTWDGGIGGFIERNTPNTDNRQTNRHHWIGVSNNTSNICKMFYGDSTSVLGTGTEWQQMGGSESANTDLSTIGADMTIGTNNTLTQKWDGWLSMFRVYQGSVTDTEAEIMWLHQKYSIIT